MYGGDSCPPHWTCGLIYSITTSGGFEAVHNFTGRSNGAFPQAALLDVNGTLYGTTAFGHENAPRTKIRGVGTVFAFTP
jgi:hypothetical protein